MIRSLCALALLVPAVASANATKASSELVDTDKQKHGADLAFDGLLQSGWGEGVAGDGAGSWIDLKLDKPTDISEISLWPGNLEKGARSLREFGRPKLVTITLTPSKGDPVTQQVRLLDGAADGGPGPQRVDVPIAGTGIVDVKINLDENYEGIVYNDTFMSEVALNFTGGWQPPQVEACRKYEGTDAAEKAAAKNKDQIEQWFATIQGAQFGDSDTLAKIMNQAGDGAPFMRERAKAVPAGFRVQALPPDDVALEALLKLKDANAIPALEMASLRVTGAEAKQLAAKAEYFYAYQEMIGGGSRNVPNWGQEGWEAGAFRSFGEPMGIQVKHTGDVLVADLANNRVQQFNPEGRETKIWGGEPSISNEWFGGKRKYYVSGGTPGKKAGQFEQPVDVAVIPGKDDDGFAVLDTAGRVQLFGEDGKPSIGWNVRTDDTISPGVGGEGYIEYVKGKIFVAWGRHAFVYSLTSEEVADWEIKDGVPNGSVTLPGGKVGLIYGKDLVMYSLDGYRHGGLLYDDDPRGEGYEDWDVTLDEDGKLWAVTDTGELVKYKKPGKVDFALGDIADHGLVHPRLAVFDDVAYVLEGDHVLKIDALALKAKQEEAAAQAAAEGTK